MKANAPEKIFVPAKHYAALYAFAEMEKDSDIESPRTDVFVDKAVEFLRKECKGFKLREIEIQKFIEYMKGE